MELWKELAFGLKIRLSGLASSGRTAGAAGLHLAVQFGIITTLFKRILMCHEEGIKLKLTATHQIPLRAPALDSGLLKSLTL